MNAKISLWHRLLLVGLLLPVSLTIGAGSDKPMDFVLPDLFILTSAFMIITGRFPISVHVVFWSFLGASVASIGLNAAVEGELVSRMVSFLRLFRSFALIYIGYHIASLYELEAIRRVFVRWSLVIVLILFGSDLLLNEGFPATRWGGSFLGLQTYGFPNSPAVFYSAYAMFLAGCALNPKDPRQLRLCCAVVLILCVAIIAFTLSRSALATLIILLLSLGFLATKRLILMLTTVALAAGVLYLLFDYFPEMKARFLFKTWRTFQSDDFSSGRAEIWQQAWDLYKARPLFGYGYEHFSNYSTYDTPHNQYLELLYKTGILGFLAMVLALLYFVRIGLASASMAERQFACLIGAWLVSSFFQPNFSYTPILNITMFFGGMMIARRSFHAATPKLDAGVHRRGNNEAPLPVRQQIGA